MGIDLRLGVATAALVAAAGLAACGGGNADRITTAADGTSDATATSSTTSGYPDGPNAPDPSSTSSTTASSTTSTSTTSTTAPAAPGAGSIVLSGTHAGDEHFALGTGRCPQIDHHLDETFTLADGSAMTFASAYCGALDASGAWSGTGTFTLTGPTGSLHGRTFSAVPHVPSPGAPYTLTVDDGTGPYAGATGSCTVDEHLEVVRFGEQRHRGSFTCTLAVPAPATTTG